jgi:elongation factor Ts
MTEISAKLVMDLRAATGLPMMKCKQALQAAGGDYEKAIDILRKEGLKAAAGKAGRVMPEGVVRERLHGAGQGVTLVLLRCETEPVRNTPDFKAFADKLLGVADAAKPADVDALNAARWPEGGTVKEAVSSLIAKIGENIEVGGVTCWTAAPGELIASYKHHDERIAAAVRLKVASVTPAVQAVAREACQHVVFSKPVALSREQIPAETVEKEREIFRGQVAQDPKMAGKPAQVVENIVKGKVEAFYKEKVLPDQPWYRDTTQSVAAVLKAQGASVVGFALHQAGA